MTKPNITITRQRPHHPLSTIAYCNFKRASCRTRIDNVWYTVEAEQSLSSMDPSIVTSTSRVIKWQGRTGMVLPVVDHPKLKDLLQKVCQASCLTIGDVRRALAVREIGVG